jgi:hypothetical protein
MAFAAAPSPTAAAAAVQSPMAVAEGVPKWVATPADEAIPSSKAAAPILLYTLEQEHLLPLAFLDVLHVESAVQ